MCSCTAVCMWSGWLLFACPSILLLNLNAAELKIKHIPPGARTTEWPLRWLSIILLLCRCSSSSHPHDIIRHSPTATRFPGKAPKNVNASVTYISIPFLFALWLSTGRRGDFCFSFFPPRTSVQNLPRCLLNGL